MTRRGLVHIGPIHFEKLKLLYGVFQTSPFTYQDAKDKRVDIHGAVLGAMFRAGSLNRIGYRDGPTNCSHKWQISEKAVETLIRRGGI
jgi:hypothetical protein